MMSRLSQLLREEPTALGTLIASVAPILVLLGVFEIDENGISAIVVGVNALVGFVVRLLVTPTTKLPAGSSGASGSGSGPSSGP